MIQRIKTCIIVHAKEKKESNYLPINYSIDETIFFACNSNNRLKNHTLHAMK